MDYGDRQERALYLIKLFREKGSEIVDKLKNRTGNEIAQEIEDQTDEGTFTVAVAGLMFQAMINDPNLGKKRNDE